MACVRNAIITRAESVDASSCRSTMWSSKIQERQDIPEYLTNDARDWRNGRTQSGLKKSSRIEQSRKTCSDSHGKDYCSHHLSPEGARGVVCRRVESTVPMKAEKKLGNLLPTRIPPARNPRSYLELYHRRFSVPQYSIRSPEGSTLSICGDSQHEELTVEDAGSLPCTSRDDDSELSFYRRLIERTAARLPGTTTRSFETLYPAISKTASRRRRLTSERDKSSVSNDKPTRKPNYRPYTIEEYRSLPIPKPDRSLGPDKVEIQAKGEWLMRRRSYGNLASERNRQRILLQTEKLKLRRGSEARECFLPPLKDKELGTKINKISTFSPETNHQEHDEPASASESMLYLGEISTLSKRSSLRHHKIRQTPKFSTSINYDNRNVL